MPVRVVVMGVAGSGKSTVGELLADRAGARYVDGDSLHPPENVAKMAAGTPLTDADRQPWLERVRDELASGDRIVVACSALKRAYRDILRGAGGVRFVFLDVDEPTARQRTRDRTAHWMSEQMVQSQFDTLERPSDDEQDIVTVDATRDEGDVIAAARRTTVDQ